MKNISKLSAFIIAMLVMFPFLKVSAQTQATVNKTILIGAGINLGAATNDPYKYIVGADISVQKYFWPGIALMLSGGYESFSIKEEFTGLAGKFDIIPVKAGVKLFLDKNFYASGAAGVGFETETGSKVKFIYAPGIGFESVSGLDVGLRYEGLKVNEFVQPQYAFRGNLGQIAVRFGYKFKLNK